MHVTADDIEKHAKAVDYFGPFERASLLVDLAADASTNAGGVGDVAAGVGAAEGGAAGAEADPDVICCESEARTHTVSAVSASLGLPYVAFKIIFAEGVLQVARPFFSFA